MEPAVPFALLGVVQLLALAGWLGVAGAASFPRMFRRLTPVFVLGALLLAIADLLTAVDFGRAQSTLLPTLRVVGFVLLTVGVLGRAMVPLSATVPAVVVPLGAPPSVAVLAGATGVVAAGAAGYGLRGAPRGIRVLVPVGILCAAVASLLAADARTSTTAAVAVLALRAAGALALLGAVAVLARTSVLARVVSGIVAGVLVMAAGAVGVVGSGVAADVANQQKQQISQVASGQLDEMKAVETQAALLARVVAACPLTGDTCQRLLAYFAVEPGYFAARVPPRGPVRSLALTSSTDVVAVQQLAAEPAVVAVLGGRECSACTPSDFTVLAGRPPEVAAIGVAPVFVGGGGAPGSRPQFAAVYGVRFDDLYTRARTREIGYDVSLLVDGRVVASDLPPAEQLAVERAASRVATSGTLATGQGAVTVPAQGSNPTVELLPVSSVGNETLQVATLAVSLPARVALQAQRRVLSRLFLTAIAVLLAAALFAILLGRRIVDPVRRLTVTAGRVRRGDLSARSGLAGADEVAQLSRAFDAMTGSLQGLTERLRATAEEESALRTRLQTVLESMSDALLATDAERRIIGINPAARTLLGLGAADVDGRPLVEVADVRDADGRALLVADRLEADGVVRRPDGRVVPVHAGVAPLEDGRGVVVVLRDTSREREIERMKTEFLSNVSHELRTPLTPIRGYAEILRRRPTLPAGKVTAYVDTILESTARMTRVVDLLVDVAALEAGRVVPARQPVAVGEFVDRLLGEWQARWPERAADLRRRVAAGLPDVDIDPHWVAKALAEVADNAVKYTAPGTPIVLSAAGSGSGHVRVAVRDGGPGIPADELPQLLSDFAQADASATRQVGGLGLGLSFVRRLADHFGLGFVVRSQPGRGSEFGLDLPTVAPVPAAPTDGRRRTRRNGAAAPRPRTGTGGSARATTGARAAAPRGGSAAGAARTRPTRPKAPPAAPEPKEGGPPSVSTGAA